MIKYPGFNILIFLLLLASGCNQNSASKSPGETTEKTTEIRGTLLNGDGEEVLLEEMGAREYIPVDTVRCNDAGEFTISFLQERIAFYVLRYGPSGYLTLLMEPGETIEFKAELEDKNAYSIKGSPGSGLLQILAAEHKKALDALGQIARKSRELVSSPDYTSIKLELDRQFDSITTEFQDYSIAYIHENPESPAILIALYNLYGQGVPVFHPRTDFPVYSFVDSVMMIHHSSGSIMSL